ncbi:MAG: hypothetical protein PHH11_15575 [Methylomonas sp.]|nr:hypothetical protein [Methylomonas sp.]
MTLHTQGLKTLEQVQAFVFSNQAISFTLTDRIAAYGWMTDTLKQFHYERCTRAERGVLRQYLRKVTGFSRAQVARCIKQFSCFQAPAWKHAISEAAASKSGVPKPELGNQKM